MAKRRRLILRRGRGHVKGPLYEREVCVRLSLWVSDFKRKDCFWRSAMSGGRSTQAKNRTGKGHDAHAGDLTCTHERGQLLISMFTVECKHYRSLCLDSLLFGYGLDLLEWWKKLLSECTEGRQPLLCAKENRRAELIFTSGQGYRWLRSGGNLKVMGIIPHLDMYILLNRDVMLLDFNRIREAMA